MTISNEYILTLQNLKGFGPKKIEQVADYIFSSHSSSLDLNGLYDVLVYLHRNGFIKGLLSFPEFFELERAHLHAQQIVFRSKELGIKMVSRYDGTFPRNLLNTVNEKGNLDIPMLLFYKGDLCITKRPAIAIIGTRDPSSEGVKAGEVFGNFFASHGLNIVSGLALGCDSSGHRGAMSAPNGVTTAFLAHGLDTIYPSENQSLAEEIIASGGLLMTEYAVGERVNRNYLIKRDRLQAALGDATLVIQSGIKGGTMHAVNASLAAGKEVYAVEYKVSVPGQKDEGNKWLIKKGDAFPLRTDNMESVLSHIQNKHTTGQSFSGFANGDEIRTHNLDYSQCSLFKD